MTTMKEALDGVGPVIMSARLKGNSNVIKYLTPDNVVHWRLHKTDIVVQLIDKSIQLNTGGWKTRSTKKYMNLLAPCHVREEDFTWYVDYNGRTYIYEDDMILHPDGTVTGAEEVK